MRTFLHFLLIAAISLFFNFCSSDGTGSQSNEEAYHISNDSLLTLIQQRTFQYFWEGAEPNSGMARERYHMDGNYPQNDKHIVTTGGSGFGLMAVLSGIERGFITREEGLQRFEKITDFLENADRFHGAWPHWLNGKTGEVKPFSPRDDGGDIVETSFLVQGMIAVAEYFKDGNDREKALSTKLTNLWHEVEWDWYQNGQNVLFWHWSPEYEWEMHHEITGYNECLITYILGASSPTHTIHPESYHEGWALNGDIQSKDEYFGMPLELEHHYAEKGGPLFWAHYSYLGLNPRNLKDRYADYWRLNHNHVLINRQHCIENPNNYEGYGENCWGLTSSYSIRDYKELPEDTSFKGMDPMVGYSGHKPENDRSVISPTAALSSFPYAPDECMKVARYLYEELGDKLLGPYGFYDAFSLEYDWFPKKYLAIDQGPIVVMIENHRSGLLWNLFMQNKDVQNGLKNLGFTYE